MTARGIVYLRHAPQGAFFPRFSRCFSTARKSILNLVSQSFSHAAAIAIRKVAIIEILKLIAPFRGAIFNYRIAIISQSPSLQIHPVFTRYGFSVN